MDRCEIIWVKKRNVSKEHGKLIVVLGMHRSGTSAITRGLQAVGANLGDRFLAPGEDNPKGFWEDKDFERLNREIFECLGASWDRLTPFTPEECARLGSAGFADRAATLLSTKLPPSGTFAFKHPRTAKLFPFWREVFLRGPQETCYLLAVRHPLSVAESLNKRDGMDKIYGSLMWLGHIIPSLDLPSGCPAMVSDYDLLIANPEAELRRIAKEFNLVVDEDRLGAYTKDFLTKDLRHALHTLGDLKRNVDVPALVADVYSGLLALARDDLRIGSKELNTKSKSWQTEFDRLIPFLQHIENTTTERNRLRIILKNATDELGWRDASLSWRLTSPLRGANTIFARLTGGR